jgi:hypothetical protein
MSEQEKLSLKDVDFLTKNNDVEAKVKVIEKITGQYRDAKFSKEEVDLTEEIFRLLLKYAEIGVRKSIAENLMYVSKVPRDVLLTLARDVEDVANPILEFSDLLTDDDLIDIIKSTNATSSQVAIARRNSVSELLSDALVSSNKGEVVENLLRNSGAEISASTFIKVADSYADKEEVVDALITRGSIPANLVREITKKVSSVIRMKLEKRYNVSFEEINGLFKESGEIAAFRFGNMKIFGTELIELVSMLEMNKQLEAALDPLHGKLTFILNEVEPIGEFIPISAIALGNKTIFEICMSRITGVKYSNISKLISDLDAGLKALYERAGLPEPLFDAVRFCIWVIDKMEDEAAKFGTKRAKDDLHGYIKRIITLSKGKNIRNLSSFVSIVRKHIDRSQGEW